jgi:ABC-type multidrug transport system fused ATPase/permease subunit
MDPAAWRRLVAWVPQRPQLFAGTIRANVTLGAAAADAAVRRALEQAGAVDFVDALPDGLNTRLSDDGAGLSAGQRQRVALARAFLRDAWRSADVVAVQSGFALRCSVAHLLPVRG